MAAMATDSADQLALTERNRAAWNAAAYDAWVSRYGVPKDAADTIRKDPEHVLRRLLPSLGDPCGRRIANPLGSHGRVAVALALLGAEVTVFDISESNARYARELASAADADITYVVGNFIDEAAHVGGRFDAVVMELGVVHYFASIDQFTAAVRSMLAPSGIAILSEFHPLMKKAITVVDDDLSLTGDYFSSTLESAPTPYEVFLDEQMPDCLIRRWTLGEIVTAFAANGFRIIALEEHPAADCPKLPGTFTLVGTAEP